MNQSEEDKQQSKLELKVRTFTGIIRESKKNNRMRAVVEECDAALNFAKLSKSLLRGRQVIILLYEPERFTGSTDDFNLLVVYIINNEF